MPSICPYSTVDGDNNNNSLNNMTDVYQLKRERLASLCSLLLLSLSLSFLFWSNENPSMMIAIWYLFGARRIHVNAKENLIPD